MDWMDENRSQREKRRGRPAARFDGGGAMAGMAAFLGRSLRAMVLHGKGTKRENGEANLPRWISAMRSEQRWRARHGETAMAALG